MVRMADNAHKEWTHAVHCRDFVKGLSAMVISSPDVAALDGCKGCCPRYMVLRCSVSLIST